MISHSAIGLKSRVSSNSFYAADAAASEELQAFERLAKRSKRLLRQPKLLDSMTMESKNPSLVGLDQEPSDSFSPEELVTMFNRKPLIVDWDKQLSH